MVVKQIVIVLYVFGLQSNFILVNRIVDVGFKTIFSKSGYRMVQGDMVLAKGV
jgi:hypothetical protein